MSLVPPQKTDATYNTQNVATGRTPHEKVRTLPRTVRSGGQSPAKPRSRSWMVVSDVSS